MSFYVDTQEQAIQIGLSHLRADLAKLSLKQLREHPDVKFEEKNITNIFDTKGKYAQKSITLDIKDVPVLLGSSPFRSGYDIWVFDRKTRMGMRIGP